jgi:two-component system, cell cycle response regulator DivK
VGNKSILIVEDDEMNQQLLRMLLASEGYDLRSASSAEEALNVLAEFKPGLILMDVQLPGKNGLELTRELRTKPELKGASIIALTAYGRKEDEQNCLNAGCDGYIAKPIDTSTFPATVRSFIDKKPVPVENTKGDVRDLLREMRNKFIAESLAEVAELLSPEAQTDRPRLVHALHRWAGIAGTLGIHGVTDQARKTSSFVESTEQVDVPAVREALEEMKRLIVAGAAVPAFDLSLPPEMVKTLSGKRVGLAGFGHHEAQRIALILDRAQCFTLSIEAPREGLSTPIVDRFDIVILNISSKDGSTCQSQTSPGLDKPVLLVGSREWITDKTVSLTSAPRDFLTTPWDEEELLVRCSKLLSKNPRFDAPPERDGPAQIVIADDDPTIATLLVAALRRTGAECHIARSGTEALALVRKVLPDVLILDVNMPGMDGFEVLTNLRADLQTARISVVLLTARQQEADVLKGFSCGASDYITKPFNPMEVTARIARYLPRKKS